MMLGFELFERASERWRVHEVFPTASYSQLAGTEKRLEIGFEHLPLGAKDVLDAAVGAFTVLEYESGRGAAVGGGDGLGRIILPCALNMPDHPVLKWPDSH